MGAALKKLPPPATYEVGYGKPPQRHRFRKGQSGNPRGRQTGSRNRARIPGPHEERLKSIILEEAYRPVTVKEANGPVTIPMAQAVLRAVAVNAAKGSQWAQRHFTELLSATERDKKQQNDQLLQTAIEYKSGWERELEYRKKYDIRAPDPIPHPDDVNINLHTGEVRFTGPATKEEKQELEKMLARKKDCEKQLAFLRGELAKDPGNQQLIVDVESEKYIFALINRAIAARRGMELPIPKRPKVVEERMRKYRNFLGQRR